MRATHYVVMHAAPVGPVLLQVMREIGERQPQLLWEGIDEDEAQMELEGYEEAFYDEQESREAGDDPRWEEPDDGGAAAFQELYEMFHNEY